MTKGTEPLLWSHFCCAFSPYPLPQVFWNPLSKDVVHLPPQYNTNPLKLQWVSLDATKNDF